MTKKTAAQRRPTTQCPAAAQIPTARPTAIAITITGNGNGNSNSNSNSNNNVPTLKPHRSVRSQLPTNISSESHCQPSADAEEDALRFNRNYIQLSALPTHSRVVRILIVENTSSHDSMAYRWKKYALIAQSYDMPDTLSVKVSPPSGILRSNAIQSVRIEIDTRGKPCEITAHLTCDFVNVSKRREHNRRVLKHETLQKELQRQFTITDGRLVNPKVQGELSMEPVTFHKTIAIHCFILNFTPEDSEMDLNVRSRNPPSKEMSIENGYPAAKLAPKRVLSVSAVLLEHVIWGITIDKMFQKTVEKILRSQGCITYQQFLMSVAERNRESEKTYSLPTKRLVATVLEQILFVIMHEEFALDTVHWSRNRPDIRYSSYRKMLPQKSESPIAKDRQYEREGAVQIQGIKKSYGKNISARRISFLK